MNHARLTRRRMLQSTAGLAVAGLAGCTGSVGGLSRSDEGPPGHGETEHGHDEVGEPVDHAEVAVNTAEDGEFHFRPHVTRVTVGGRVTWVLESGTHTATAYHPGNDQPRLVPRDTEAWDSGTLSEQGQTYEHAFDVEGVYHYYCEPHEQFGMLGTVVVGDPNPGEVIALRTVPADKPESVRGKLEELNTMVRSALEDGHEEGGTPAEGSHDEEGTHTEDGHDEEGTHEGDGHQDG